MNKIILYTVLVTILTACGNDTKNKYVTNCVLGANTDSMAAQAICSCAYDKTESKLGEEKLEELITQPIPNKQDTEDFLNIYLKSTAQCMREMGFAR